MPSQIVPEQASRVGLLAQIVLNGGVAQYHCTSTGDLFNFGRGDFVQVWNTTFGIWRAKRTVVGSRGLSQ